MAFLDDIGLDELWSLVRNADVKIEKGSYVGTGVYGENNRNSLTFGFAPKLVFFDGSFQYTGGYNYSKGFSVFMAPDFFYGIYTNNGFAYPTYYSSSYLTLNGNTLSWYSPSNPAQQRNESGQTYNYIAIG